MRVQPLIDCAPRSPIFSTWDVDNPAFAALRRSELIGRLLGDDAISRHLDRVVRPRKRGRKPKGDVAGAEAKGNDGRVAVIRNPLIPGVSP